MAALPFFFFVSFSLLHHLRHRGIVWKILRYKWIVEAFSLNERVALLLPILALPSSTSSTLLRLQSLSGTSQVTERTNLTILKKDLLWTDLAWSQNSAAQKAEFCTNQMSRETVNCTGVLLFRIMFIMFTILAELQLRLKGMSSFFQGIQSWTERKVRDSSSGDHKRLYQIVQIFKKSGLTDWRCHQWSQTTLPELPPWKDLHKTSISATRWRWKGFNFMQRSWDWIASTNDKNGSTSCLLRKSRDAVL